MSDQTPGTTPPPVPATPPPVPATPPPAPAASAEPPPSAAAAPATRPGPVIPPPAQPGPPQPAGAAPFGDYFKSGKNKTIGLIVAGVVVVGTLGGLVGALAGGGGGDAPSVNQPQVGTGVLNPAPVGSADPITPADPGEDPAPAEPSPEAPAPTPTPEPAPAPEPAPQPASTSGDAVTLAGGIQVAVPSGWQVLGAGDTDVALQDSGGNFIYAVVGQVEPARDAASVLNKSMDNVLSPDQYTQLQTGEITPIGPFGSVTSIVSMDYLATWADPQVAIPLYGRLYAMVRQDGMALIITAEHTPPEEFANGLDALGSVLDPTINAFGR